MWGLRVILILGVLWVLIALLGWLIRQVIYKSLTNTFAKKPPKVDEKALVICHTCKTYIDKDKALVSQDRYFCSQEHKDASKD